VLAVPPEGSGDLVAWIANWSSRYPELEIEETARLRSVAELTPAEFACRLIAEISTVLKINGEERRLSIEPWTTFLISCAARLT
jgi:hypothetical protein